MVKVTYIQVDITFIIPKSNDVVPFTWPKELNGLSGQVLSYWFPLRKSFYTGVGKEMGSEGGVRGVRAS